MSSTEIRNARRIWAALLAYVDRVGFEGRLMFSAGELGKEAEVSTQTARKYLGMAVGEGVVSSWRMATGRVVYTFDRGNS